ncbi:MAG: extracellular solute-binding protein [Deltaproteobacteria bacterium]|nr:extracellular solute-binding protein [Deltaproteobacteria bacterium]
MNTENRRSREYLLRVLLLLLTALISFPLPGFCKTAGEILGEYSRLADKEREAKILEGAKRESKLIYYGTTAIDHIQRVFTEFKKRYPFMEVADYRSGSVNVYNKIATEARAKRFEVDVFDLEPGEVYGITKTGLADPYLSPSRKGIAPEFMDRQGYWTTFYHLTVVLGYNTEKVKKDEAPKTYDDLLDPKWKGRMSIDQTDFALFGAMLEYWGREKGANYFRKLADNDPSMRRGKTLQAQILGAGEVHVAPWLYGYRPLAMKREGAPVDINLLRPVLSVPTYLLLAKNSSRPHSAALFLDWALSRDGIMKVFAEELGRGVPRSGYKDIFPELNAPQYLVVEPTKIGPRYEEYEKLYCSIFKHC